MLDLRNTSLIILLQVYEGLAHLSCSLSYERSYERSKTPYYALYYERSYTCLVYCLTKGLQKVYECLTPGLKINLLRRLNDEH